MECFIQWYTLIYSDIHSAVFLFIASVIDRLLLPSTAVSSSWAEHNQALEVCSKVCGDIITLTCSQRGYARLYSSILDVKWVLLNNVRSAFQCKTWNSYLQHHLQKHEFLDPGICKFYHLHHIIITNIYISITHLNTYELWSLRRPSIKPITRDFFYKHLSNTTIPIYMHKWFLKLYGAKKKPYITYIK